MKHSRIVIRTLSYLSTLCFFFYFTSCQNDIVQDSIKPNSLNSTNVNYIGKINATSPNVSSEDARKIALLFQGSQNYSTRAYTKAIAEIKAYNNKEGESLFYVVQYTNEDGYILISSDKKIEPILAYSDKGSFEKDKIFMKDWLEDIKEKILFYKTDTTNVFNIGWLAYSNLSESLHTTRAINLKEMWQNEIMNEYRGKSNYVDFTRYQNYSHQFTSLKNLENYIPGVDKSLFQDIIQESERLGFEESDILCQVFYCYNNYVTDPLMNTLWSQGAPYNGAISGLLGCSTIAVGQFMNYYKAPVSKDWGQIGITGSIAQQLFLKEVGEKLGINYAHSDRGADHNDVINALRQYGYNIYKTENTPNITSLIEAGKPVIVGGFTTQFLGQGTGDGHIWIIDGAKHGYNEIIVDIYAPIKQEYISYELQPDENPYYLCNALHPSSIQSHNSYYHMNWGGAESWNLADDYLCPSNGKTYKRDKRFIYAN